MKYEKDVTNISIIELNNFCVQNDFEIEIRDKKVYLQLLEVKNDQ